MDRENADKEIRPCSKTKTKYHLEKSLMVTQDKIELYGHNDKEYI